MGASAPGGNTATSIRNQMRTEAGRRDPNAMGGFRNAPLRQEERRPQAGVQDARDKYRDAIRSSDTFKQSAAERDSAMRAKALENMMRQDAARTSAEARDRNVGPFSNSSATFLPSEADLATPGGEQYGDMAGNISKMQNEKEFQKRRSDDRQLAFARYAEAMQAQPKTNQFGGENVLTGYQPSQGFGAYMSQMQPPDSASQIQFRDQFLGMADMRNAMGGEQQQRTFRAQQLRPAYGQENVGGMRFANTPEMR